MISSSGDSLVSGLLYFFPDRTINYNSLPRLESLFFRPGFLHPSGVSVAPKQSRRILLIEDEAAVSNYLSLLLEQEGFHITRVFTLAAARASLPAHFDLILLDLMLPDGTGDDLLPNLRTAAPNTPILMVTGAPPNDDRLVQCLKSGAAGYIPKTGRIEELLRHVRRALGE